MSPGWTPPLPPSVRFDCGAVSGTNSQWHQDTFSSFTSFFLVKADFCVFCENSFGDTAHIVLKQVSPVPMRISFYYSAHFLNLTLIKCILCFIITNKQLAVLKIYGWVLPCLMTVSAFQFQMRYRVSGLSGKLIAVENLAQAALTQTSLGTPSSSPHPFSGPAAREVEEGEIGGG